MFKRFLAVSILIILTACSGSSEPEQGVAATIDASNASQGIDSNDSEVPDPNQSETTATNEVDTQSPPETNETPADVPTEPIPVEEDQAPKDDRIVTAEAMASCALVEVGFIAGLDGDASAPQLLSDGAAAAIGSQSVPYPELGELLAAATNPSDVALAAEALLVQCEQDGFERLAG